MTNQLAALQELEQAVVDEMFPVDLTGRQMGFPDVSANEIYHAYSGSLDAAKSLHDASLTNRWTYCVRDSWSNVDQVDVALDKKDARGNRSINTVGHTSYCSPARAWLVAIIRAKITELEGGE